MKVKNNDLLVNNRIFAWGALATSALLLFPYLAMKYNWQIPDPGSSVQSGFDWSPFDFAVMGSLIYGMGTLFVLVARRVERKNRFAVAIICGILFFYIWAELAVGIFTHLGS